MTRVKAEYDSRKLAEAAQAHGFNARTLAIESGVSYGTVLTVFRGGRVGATSIRRLCAAIDGLEVADLVIDPTAGRRRRRSSNLSPLTSNRERSE